MHESTAKNMLLSQDMSFEAAEIRFLETLKERIQSVAENFDEGEVSSELQSLRELHREFFNFTLQWAVTQAKQRSGPPDLPDAKALKLKAREVIDTLQKHIVEFSLCYMQINRFTTLLRDEIKGEEDRMPGHFPRDIEWTADAGIMISRYKNEKSRLLDMNTTIEAVRPTLSDIGAGLARLEELSQSLLGAEKSTSFMRSLVASLRVSNFDRAAEVIRDTAPQKKKGREAEEKEFTELATNTLALVRDHQTMLEGAEKKLFLYPAEAEMAYNANVRELKKIKEFLWKYHMPYMQYKLDSMFHLKEKLLVIGSVEGLMTLYVKLIRGLALPMTDLKTIRLYESDVLERITYLLSGHFQEVPKLLQRAEETVHEFRIGKADYRNIEDLEFEEIGGQSP